MYCINFYQKFTGRKRNCYGIGMRYVNKALMYSTIGRKLKKKDMAQVSQNFVF